MKQFALIAILFVSSFASAQKIRFRGCESEACNSQQLKNLEQRTLATLKAQYGYIMADSLYLEFTITEKGKVKIIDEFSTSSISNLIVAKKMLKAAGDSLAPSSGNHYEWTWNISLPESTKSYKGFYETKHFPIVLKCNDFNEKGQRGCLKYLIYQSAKEIGGMHQETGTMFRFYIKKGKIVATETPHPPMKKIFADQLTLTFQEKLKDMTTQSSRSNFESFFIDYNVELLDDSTSIYKAYFDRLEPLSALKSKRIYHKELLNLKATYYKNKPREGAQFLLDQLVPLGLNSTTPYRIDSISYDLDSLQNVAKNGANTSPKEDDSNTLESIPITMSCVKYKDDNEKLKVCFQEHILTHVSENYIYPKNGREDRIKGRSYVNFVIQKDKTIDKVYIVKGVHPNLDIEAIRVVSEIPDMYQPAINNGEPVQMSFTLPINAKLH